MLPEKICGKCGWEYCNYCTKRKKHIDVLMVACDDYIPFNKGLYARFKREYNNQKFNYDLGELE